MGWNTEMSSEMEGTYTCSTLEFFIQAQAVVALLFGRGFEVLEEEHAKVSASW